MYFNIARKSKPTHAPGKRPNSGKQEKRQPSNPYKNDQPTI
jgi:hypothetical protein